MGRRQKDHANIGFTKDYDELKAIRDIEKTGLMSVVVSSKEDSHGHRQRLVFARQLKEYFGDRICLFGRGINEVADKWDALAPYKYHVALENCAVADYWTEKLADAFLAGCHPVYYGCSNIDQYFPQGALTPIDIQNPTEAIKTVETCIEAERYEHSKDLIWESRRLVLDRHNMFAMIADYVNKDIRQSGKKKPPDTIKLKKEPSDSNLMYKLKTLLSG